MSANPINELKRRLVDDTTPLPKRLCLARNVINTHHFPTAAKERLIGEWLQGLTDENELSAEELRNVIGWLNVEDLTRDFKGKLVQIVSTYVQRNSINKDDVQSIISFLENVQVSSQLSIQTDDYLSITTTLLQYLRVEENSNFEQSNKILDNLIKYYKDSKKKYEFIIKFLQGNNIETVFDYLDTKNRDTVTALCENALFPMNKRSFFITLLKTYIRTDNIDDLIAEKGDNIQSVLNIMDAFFGFPKRRTNNDPKFLKNFTDMFVSCYKKENQLIFAFYIMICNGLQMEQNYLIPTTSIKPISLEDNTEKVKRTLFLNMLEILLKNEVDIDIRLTDTLGEKISKVETKKTFLLFLQATMMGQLKLEGKLDKTTIQIIHTALKLDPTLIENKIKEILPPIMTAKKSNSGIKEAYVEMMNCLLDILFKLSRGIPFLNNILPLLNEYLEASNTEQFELKMKIKELAGDSKDYEKVKNKLIAWDDIFPVECVEIYGKLTSELMFRQNKELLALLQKDFEDVCLKQLDEDILKPSTIVLTELLSAILSTFFRYNKMADHTVPLYIAEDFWSSFQCFEDVCLKKFAECVIKHGCEPSLLQSFLQLCLDFSQLKLLNITYSNTKLDLPGVGNTDVYDLSAFLLPFLDGEQWKNICSSIENNQTTAILDKLVLITIKFKEILSETEIMDENIVSAKSRLIKQTATNSHYFTGENYFTKVLLNNLDKNLLKQMSKCIIKLYLSSSDQNILKNEAIMSNRDLLNALVIETCRNITKCLDNTELLAKSLNKTDSDLGEFAKEHNMKKYFEKISKIDDDSAIANCVEILKELQIYYLEEKYQLVAIFVLLALKKCCHKKMRRNIDVVLHNIFELSTQSPDLYKIFPIQFIFSFQDETLLNLLTLKNKTSNSMLIIKSILESTVKRVRSESSLVINVVEILLKNLDENKSTNIEYFSDTAFQISCIILPLIAKQKKALTSSAFRSILADLQEKLHKSMLDAFKSINFKDNSLLNTTVGNTEESMVVSENEMAILNAMAAYSLTLSKYCETTDVEEIKNLDCLWSGLEFFVQNAIHTLVNPETKSQNLETSIQLLNITLRYLKKLESHYIFETKDKILLQIWQSVKTRLFMIFESGSKVFLEDIGVTIKFLCEHTDVDCFVNNYVSDLTALSVLEKPLIKRKEDIQKIPNSLKVSQFLWTNCLKANITGPKCISMTKSIYQTCKSARNYIWQHYGNYQYGVVIRRKKKKMAAELRDVEDINVVKLDDYTCELIRMYLSILTETIMAAKKITLDYKFLDAIFELQQQIHVILGFNTTNVRCEVSWQSFFALLQGSIGILNSLIVAREELLEDRWPCYMHCYRVLVVCLCERSIDTQPGRDIEEKLAETAHNIEKLTQSMSKRKTHISRIAAYTVAELCATIERTAPSRVLRQHIENSISLLIQASDTTYCVAFLRRALAGCPGQITLTNLYTMYKRYHKYTGNA